MKSYKVKFRPANQSSSLETVIQAKYESDARNLIKAQYGSNTTIFSVSQL